VDEPDWDAVISEHGGWLSDADALTAAEVYSIFTGSPCEKRFKSLAEEYFKLPCVCAGELTTGLNVLVRAATALLNARMSPIVREFVEAASADFASRGCNAPVMIVRSDGSLMSSELSGLRPVETILSGPAASVLAGKSFCEARDYIVVDMGGTTTDISVVLGGKAVTAESGIEIGGWKTSVRGVRVTPFALGGDSAVRLKDGRLTLFPRRVTPLCVASRRWSQIKPRLARLIEQDHINQFPLHEFFYLVREPAAQKSYDADERALINALRDGPCMLGDLGDIGIDLYHFDGERLESEGVIMRCGLTPTDFMHIKGDYTEFDGEASRLAARYLLRSMEREDSPESILALADELYHAAEGLLYENLLRVILAHEYPEKFGRGIDAQMEFLIRQTWENRDSGGADSLLRHSFGAGAALVGIGAPTHVFLPAAARALGAQCVLPEHAEVANALGALKADINAIVRVEISQRPASSGETFYIVHSPTGSERFTDAEEAKKTALAAAEAAAMREARLRGGTGKLEANTYIQTRNTVSRWGMDVTLGAVAVSEVAVHLG
jgi:N-methylhydantoinase A/oxoprolinase/acetone carboxylase beta subunit